MKMDISSVLAQRSYGGEPRRVSVGAGPFSIWPRLAVCPTVRLGGAQSLAQKRVIRDFEFVLLVRGRGWVWWEPSGASIELAPGDVVLFVPGVVHGWAAEDNTHLALHFDLHAKPGVEDMDTIKKLSQWVERKPTGEVPCFKVGLAGEELLIPLVTHVRAPEEWQKRLMPLVERYHAKTLQSGLGRLMAAEAVGWGLRTLAEEAKALMGQRGMDERVVRALAAAQGDGAAGGAMVARMAKAAGMGATAFGALFLKSVGRPARAYVEEKRVAKAKQLLLETGRGIAEVAEACGYLDPYHFSRVFKRVTGESPRAFRKAR